jgi:hypothetical protein
VCRNPFYPCEFLIAKCAPGCAWVAETRVSSIPCRPPVSGLLHVFSVAMYGRGGADWTERLEVPAGGSGRKLSPCHPNLRPLSFHESSPRASIAGRVLEAVVASPVAVGLAEVGRRAAEDDLAAAGASHVTAGDEESEALPQRSCAPP